MFQKLTSKSKRHKRATTLLEALESRTLLSAVTDTVITTNLQIAPNAGGSSSIQGYTPAQIRTAYGFTNVSGNGSGQTIAIIDAYNDPSIAADLNVFDTQFGLPSADLSVVSQTGGSVRSITTDTGWAGEISLDVEWAHAIAPGAHIMLVEANSDSIANLLTAVSYARSVSDVSVVSMSWGGGEFSTEAAFDSYFTTPVGHQGITFVASAGDDGAGSAEWPAASPNVLSIGGTTLQLDSSGNYISESVWSDGGGGISNYESQPAYQDNAQSSGGRSTPDVAYDANPNTGFAVYDSISDQGYVGWQEVGGTSAGAPQWSALVAIADQGRVANGDGSLDGSTATVPVLYSLYSVADQDAYNNYTDYFNDIIGGGGHGFGGGFGEVATLGYDGVTGLGTPQVPQIVGALEGLSAHAAAKAGRAAHQARKLAKAERARGKDNPGLTDSANANLVMSSGADASAASTLANNLAGAAVSDTILHATFSTQQSSPTLDASSGQPLFASSAQMILPQNDLIQPAAINQMPAIGDSRRFAGAFATMDAQSADIYPQALADADPATGLAADLAQVNDEDAIADVTAAGTAVAALRSPQDLARSQPAFSTIATVDAPALMAADVMPHAVMSHAVLSHAAMPHVAPFHAAAHSSLSSHGRHAAEVLIGLDAIIIGYWFAWGSDSRKARRKKQRFLKSAHRLHPQRDLASHRGTVGYMITAAQD